MSISDWTRINVHTSLLSYVIMKYPTPHNLLALTSGLAVIGLFVAATLFAQTYATSLETYLSGASTQSMLAYVLITVTGTVLAPISTIPLIPIAAQSWGWFTTGILSIVGWVIGSQIAFLVARHYGTRFVKHFVPLRKIQNYEATLSAQNLFWTVVLLRLVVPVDVLSYALGLFSTMTARSYLLATTIGVTPFAFIFAYTGTLPPGLQIMVITEILLLFGLIYYIRRKFRTK